MPDDGRLLPGKLPADVLDRLLASREAPGGAVVGPGIGLDAAVLSLRPPPRPGEATAAEPPPFLVAASDPVTFAAEEIGWYAVHVNANDVVCMGAHPRWFLATILLPVGATTVEAEAIFEQMDSACAEVGAALVGGHTEITQGVDRPIVTGTMLGVTHHWISAAGACPGDILILTKGVALEGSAILAREAADRLEGRVDDAMLERARGFLHDPGISVVPDALAVLAAGKVHALHDPTEGGVVGAIHELCDASGTGALVHLDAIPVFAETRALAAPFDIDPLGLIASGALLIAAPEEEAPAILAALAAEGIRAAAIGTVEHAARGTCAVVDGEDVPLPRFRSDEISKAL